MPRPGISITSREQPPTRTRPVSVGTSFMAGLTEKGSAEDAIVLVHNLEEFEQRFGTRQSYSVLYDAVETHFREGGAPVHVARVLGPAPVSATTNLFDQAGSVVPGDVALVATAESPGEWGNSLNVEVTVSGTNFTVIVSHDTLGELERSPLLADRDAAVLWSSGSSYVRLTLGASNEDPRVQGPTSLATGADDRANVTDAQWLTALNLFVRDLGPGQVLAPGRTTAAGHQQLLAHAKALDRVALLDSQDVASAVTLIANATTSRNADARYGALFAPWVKVPGLTAGTTRTVPPSSVVSGLIGRNDGQGRSPNEPSAGDRGISLFATGLSQPAWTDAEREDLNEGGVDVVRQMFGQVRVYGWRSLVDPIATPDWVNFGNSRLYMGIASKADDIAERFVFRQLDGRKRTISEFAGELTGMLVPYWEDGSLYGESARDAFLVDVGPAVNTPTTIANGELRAVLGLRMSPFGELVEIEIVKIASSEVFA